MKEVWVVSWSDDGEEPTVTVFNNKDAGYALFKNELGLHDHLCIDCCEVYSEFLVY